MTLMAEVEAEPPPAQPPPPPRKETCRHCGQPIQTCRSCAAFIIWVVTAKGQRMPLDAAVTAIFDFPEGDDETTDHPGEALGGSPWYMVKGHVSHFATCPQASQWRKGARA